MSTIQCPICHRQYDQAARDTCPSCKCYAPTQAEIRAACLEIQATWSPRVERERRCVHALPVETEIVTVEPLDRMVRKHRILPVPHRGI